MPVSTRFRAVTPIESITVKASGGTNTLVVEGDDLDVWLRFTRGCGLRMSAGDAREFAAQLKILADQIDRVEAERRA